VISALLFLTLRSTKYFIKFFLAVHVPKSFMRYKCQKCGEKFVLSQDLKTHAKKCDASLFSDQSANLATEENPETNEVLDRSAINDTLSSPALSCDARKNDETDFEPNRQVNSALRSVTTCSGNTTWDENEGTYSEPNKQGNCAPRNDAAFITPKIASNTICDASKKGLTKNVEESSFDGIGSVKTRSRKGTNYNVRHWKRDAKKGTL
jgi:hypothetical protein